MTRFYWWSNSTKLAYRYQTVTIIEGESSALLCRSLDAIEKNRSKNG